MSVQNGKIDRRVIKTKKAIRTAFVKLMAEKEIDRITIKELAEEADVDRKTIYNYYNSVQEIGEEFSNELFELFETQTKEYSYQLSNPYESFGVLTKILSENLELYGQLINLNVTSHFFQISVNYFKSKIRDALKQRGDLTDIQVDFTTEYLTNGLFAAYRCWFNSDRSLSLEEFSSEMGKLVLEGVNKYLHI
jgi:AcrR family transcriptional regulator